MTETVQPPPDDQMRLLEAKQRVAALKGFYIHLAVYVAVLVLLFAINLAFSPIWWVHWVFLGWGIGIVAHAAAVFGRTPKPIADWEERKVRQIMSER